MGYRFWQVQLLPPFVRGHPSQEGFTPYQSLVHNLWRPTI